MLFFCLTEAEAPSMLLPVETLVAVIAARGAALAMALLPAGLAAVACWSLWRGRRRLRGTTLIAPWCWTFTAIAAVGASEAWLSAASGPAEAWTTHVRYVAATATHAGLIAVLGARRPQDRAWQLIVATLLVLLTWPAAAAWLYRPDRALELHSAWKGFHMLLIGLAFFNGMPTRHWPTAALWTAGQVLLLAAYVPDFAFGWLTTAVPAAGIRGLMGVAALCLAQFLWGLDVPRARRSLSPTDRLWCDFRDAFGALWALRVLEGFNAAAAMYSWEARMTWAGLRNTAAALTAAPAVLSSAMRQTLDNLLRRFVNAAWIAERTRDA
jgi:hypothetical protein